LKKIFLVCVVILCFFSSLYASNEERDLQAVFLAKFAKFIELPNADREKFVITIIYENPIEDILQKLYKDKKINNKPVEIRFATQVEEIEKTDILFITIQNPQIAQKAIEYAQANGILTISEQRGFAQRGGIIQLNFVQRRTHLVINHEASLKSNIKIDSKLLAIAQEVIRGDKK
jgi:hypothetical protein